MLQQLISSKTEWTWNATYQKLFDKAISIITEDACIEFYNETQPLYLEADASGMRLRASLLQTRSNTSCSRDKAPESSILRPTAFESKSLSSAERRYSNIKRGAIHVHGPKKFHHYCFVREMSIITDYKLLVAIFKKDVAMLSQGIKKNSSQNAPVQSKIICKPGPDLFIAEWLSRKNHKENKNEEIPCMQLNVDTIQTTTNILDCMTIQPLQQATLQDDHLQLLKDYIIRGWPDSKDQIPQDMWTYWTLWDDMAVINGAILTSWHVVIAESLKSRC